MDNTLSCFVEQLINYIDARFANDLSEAYDIKRKLISAKPVTKFICHMCGKVDNTGKVVQENGKLGWECTRCTNMEIIRRTTLFTGKRNEKEKEKMDT